MSGKRIIEGLEQAVEHARARGREVVRLSFSEQVSKALFECLDNAGLQIVPTSWEGPRLSTAVPAGHVKVRIAVAVAPSGAWGSWGFGYQIGAKDKHEGSEAGWMGSAQDCVYELVDDPKGGHDAQLVMGAKALFWVEAVLPLPKVETVTGVAKVVTDG